MSALNQKLVSAAVEQALRYIPVVWPLQQLIATNPLWEVIDRPIEKISQTLQGIDQVQTTLALAEYWQYYGQQQITDASIHQSITELSHLYLHQHADSGADPAREDLLQRLLYGFMTSCDYQQQLIAHSKKQADNLAAGQKILFSYQAQDYGYDNALSTIQSECLNWLASYFNPSLLQKNLTQDLGQDTPYRFYTFWHTLMSHKDAAWQQFLADYSRSFAV